MRQTIFSLRYTMASSTDTRMAVMCEVPISPLTLIPSLLSSLTKKLLDSLHRLNFPASEKYSSRYEASSFLSPSTSSSRSFL